MSPIPPPQPLPFAFNTYDIFARPDVIPLPSLGDNTGGFDVFQAAQSPINPYALPPSNPGGVPGGIPGLPPIPDLPPLPGGTGSPSGDLPMPTLPTLPGSTGSSGSGTPTAAVPGLGDTMRLFNDHRLGDVVEDGGQRFYRGQRRARAGDAEFIEGTPESGQPMVTDNQYRYHVLPDGSLLRTDNAGAGGTIIYRTAAGATASRPVDAANDADMIAWARAFSALGGARPVVGSPGTYETTGGERFVLVPSVGANRGILYRVSGTGSAEERLTHFDNTSSSSVQLPAATFTDAERERAINQALFIQRMGLVPRRHQQVVLGGLGIDGNRVNIAAGANQWVQLSGLASSLDGSNVTSLGGVFTLEADAGGNLIMNQRLATTDTTNRPQIIRWSLSPDGNLVPQVDNGGWQNISISPQGWIYYGTGADRRIWQRDGANFVWGMAAPPGFTEAAGGGNILVPRPIS